MKFGLDKGAFAGHSIAIALLLQTPLRLESLGADAQLYEPFSLGQEAAFCLLPGSVARQIGPESFGESSRSWPEAAIHALRVNLLRPQRSFCSLDQPSCSRGRTHRYILETTTILLLSHFLFIFKNLC